MSYLKSTWLRPAAILLVVLAVAALSLTGAHSTEAGNPGSVSVTSASVGVGGTTTVTVSATAPDGGLSVWIVAVAYDPTKVQVETTAPNLCVAPEIPNPAGAGTLVQASSCGAKDSLPTNGQNDTAVAFGAWIKNVGGVATGWTGTNAIATFTFRAVGVAGDVSPLTVSVSPGDFLRPDTTEATPTTSNGTITITETTTTNRVWGDVNCSGGLDPVDSLIVLRADAGLTTNNPQGCPAMKSPVTVNGITVQWGDSDCSGALDPVDSLKTLRSDAGLTVNQTVQGCPNFKSTAQVG